MPKNKSEIIAEAHRRIQVLSVDEDPSADMVTYGGNAADALLAELKAVPHSMGFTWGLDAVPDEVFRPLSWLLAVDLAAHYLVPAPETRARAVQRLAAIAFPDDREEVEAAGY